MEKDGRGGYSLFVLVLQYIILHFSAIMFKPVDIKPFPPLVNG